MKKREVVLYIAMSLDGYIADTEGGINWLSEVAGQDDNGYLSFYSSIDTLIMGRRTYDQLLAFGCEWPYKGKACYVFTTRPAAPDANVTFVQETPSALLARLQQQEGGRIWLVGGADLVQQFLAETAIDTLALAVIPMLLGDGIRLFKEGIPKTKLSLRQIEHFGEILLLHYQRNS